MYTEIARVFLDAFRGAADPQSDCYCIKDRCVVKGDPRVRDPRDWILSKFPDGWTLADFPHYPLIVIPPASVSFDITVEGIGRGRPVVEGSVDVILYHRGKIADFDALSDEVLSFLRTYDWKSHGIYVTGIRDRLIDRDFITKPSKFYGRVFTVEFLVNEAVLND